MSNPTLHSATKLTQLSDAIAKLETSDIGKFAVTKAETQDDFDARVNYMKADNVRALELVTPWAEKWPATKENIIKIAAQDPEQFANECLRWIRSSTAKTAAISIYLGMLPKIAQRADTLLKEEADAAATIISNKQDEIDEELANVQTLEDKLVEAEVRAVQAEGNKDSWFTKYEELLAKYNSLRTSIADNPNGDVSFSTARSDSHKNSKVKLPHPKPLKDEFTPTEYKHWVSEMENKMEAESFDDSSSKAYFMNQVEGTMAKEALLMLHTTLGKPRSEVTIQHMWDAMKERFADPFERQNAKKAYKALMMKPYSDFLEFRNQFTNLATLAGVHEEDWKVEMHEKMYSRLREATAREKADPAADWKLLAASALNISREYKLTHEENQKKKAQNQSNSTNNFNNESRTTGSNTSNGGGQRPTSSSSNRGGFSNTGNALTAPRPGGSGFGRFREYGLDVNQAIDLTKRNLCFKCKKPGHRAANCTETEVTELTPETGAMVIADQPKN